MQPAKSEPFAIKARLIFIQIPEVLDSKRSWDPLLRIINKLPYKFLSDVGDTEINVNKIPKNAFCDKHIPILETSKHFRLIITHGATTSLLASILTKKPLLVIPKSDTSRQVAKLCIRNKVGYTLEYNDIEANLASKILSLIHLDLFESASAHDLSNSFNV